MELSFDLRYPFYDCLYVALASYEAIPLVSADKRLLTAAQKGGLQARSL